MNQRYLFTLFLAFLTLYLPRAYAQGGQTATISGMLVQKETAKPLGFATVSLFSQQDSLNQYNRLTGEDGSFRFKVAPGSYYLVAKFLGFKNATVGDIQVGEAGAVQDLGLIALEEEGVALDEVVISEERSMMEMRLDKRVFNVGRDLTGAGNSAADILNSVPSVNVDPEGTVSLRGSEGVRILVDGKPSALLSSGDLNALQRLQGDIIESVEVITNPSARYEAEGEAGIINIILKKNRKRGINGSFGLTAGNPDNYGGSYSLNFRRNDFNFFSNFGISYRKNPGGGTSSQQFFNNGELDEFYTSETNQRRGGIGGNLQLGADWFIDERNTLTGSLLYRRSRDRNTATVIYEDLDGDFNLLDRTVRDNVEISNNHNLEAALNYKRTFAKEDQQWTIDFKHFLDDDLELTDYEETYLLSTDPVFQRSSNTEYEQNTLFQTDYVHPINDSTKFEVGLRSNFRTVKNRFLVEEENEAGDYIPLAAFDDELVYTENISAAYVIGATELGKLNVQAGLRAEYSDITASLLKSEVQNNQYYLSFFPSASMTYKFSTTNQLQASYSRRLSRPWFRLLLPFSNFTNPRNNRIGNPTLRPEFTNSFELGFLHYLSHGSLLVSTYYRQTSGVIERIILPSEDGTTIRYPVNLSRRDAFGLEASFSYDFTDWWKFNADFNVYQAFLDGSFEGVDYSADIFTWTAQANTTLNLAKGLQLQANFDYDAPRNNPQGRILARWALNGGLSVDVLKGKGTITLSGRDLFNTRIYRRVVDQPDYQSVTSFQWRRARRVLLNFVYRLNQGKKDSRS